MDPHRTLPLRGVGEFAKPPAPPVDRIELPLGPDVPSRLELAVFVGDAVYTHALRSSGRMTIGRSSSSDICIDHPSVSRNHAVLHLDPELRIEDLGGINGTSVLDVLATKCSEETDSVQRISRQAVAIGVGECIGLGSIFAVVRRVAEAQPARLRLGEDGAWFAVSPNASVSLTRRQGLRRILLRLVEQHRTRPGTPVSRDALLAAGWPGERIQPEAGADRVRVAIFTLRKLGLGELLRTGDDGYLLDQALSVIAAGK